MSDWRRSDRDHEMGRYGSEARGRRESGAQDRWREESRRAGEQRSFDEQHPAPERGGYTGESFGGPDFMRQDRSGRDFRGESYAREGYRSEGEERRYGGQAYGERSYGGEDQERRYGRERPEGGAIGDNPAIRRVADGDTDHGWRSNMHMGEHRGRGPKNYTRSDDRIREDVNDRLSDDSWLDASEIEVQVATCEVTLTGKVQSREDKRRAEDVAEQVSGVKHVQNNLRVEPHPTQDPRTTPANAGGSAPPVT